MGLFYKQDNDHIDKQSRNSCTF